VIGSGLVAAPGAAAATFARELFNAFRGCACATTLPMAVAHALRLAAPAHLITSSSFDRNFAEEVQKRSVWTRL
jgi:hypothetical protein